jgi:hypothetical protein
MHENTLNIAKTKRFIFKYTNINAFGGKGGAFIWRYENIVFHEFVIG